MCVRPRERVCVCVREGVCDSDLDTVPGILFLPIFPPHKSRGIYTADRHRSIDP